MYLLNNRKWNPKTIVAVGGFIALAGKWFASYTTDIWLFIALYGILGGIGNGMSYMIPLVCTWEYFPKRRGLVTGIIVSGYGLGSFISAQGSTLLVNPESKNATIVINEDLRYFTWDVASRVPSMMRTLCAIWTVLTVSAVILISRPVKKEDE